MCVEGADLGFLELELGLLGPDIRLGCLL